MSTRTQIDRAAYNLMHRSEQRLEDIADWLEKAANTLQNEVNPRVPSAKLGLADAVEATQFTGNLVVLNSFAAAVKCIVFKVPEAGTHDVNRDIAAMAKEFGELVSTVSLSLADGSVSDNDMKAINTEGQQLMAAVQAAIQHLASMNERKAREGAPA